MIEIPLLHLSGSPSMIDSPTSRWNWQRDHAPAIDPSPSTPATETFAVQPSRVDGSVAAKHLIWL
jgi:hypothetical protein